MFIHVFIALDGGYELAGKSDKLGFSSKDIVDYARVAVV